MTREKPDQRPRIYFADLMQQWSRSWVGAGAEMARLTCLPADADAPPSNVVSLATRRAAGRLDAER